MSGERVRTNPGEAVAGELESWQQSKWSAMRKRADGLALCIIRGLGEFAEFMPEETKTVKASAEVLRERQRRFRRTRARELKMIAKALASTKHPILVHIIPMRRCNLDCGYCNEYDNVSKPVPLEEMKKRLDILADMGTSIITISGGEPLMHPELEEVIRHIRKRGMIAGMITNGFLLSKERIGTLNEAGLEHLQISIDNLVPDEVSKKSLKTLDIRLEWLCGVRGVSGEHQFGAWERSEGSGGCAEDCAPGGGAGIYEHGGNYPRPQRAIEAAGTARAGNLRRDHGRWGNGRSRDSMIFSTAWRAGKSTIGVAVRGRGICIFAKTGWCTGVRSSADIRGFRWRSIRMRCGIANTTRRNIARRCARSRACNKWG